ncbi:DNA topoisomerase-1 [Litoreibacter ponti]|uniref:DNA topoisomerase n=1 Tax=Litoreibacter ponti TaxID=1510457 RepID=A0A2T6BE05_9RHOB|nr:DNA topoisomerase IB [Litoreibacter ponti]PTX54287.1 DNA topoisomerase-1 [Litoreibacter ponti]
MSAGLVYYGDDQPGIARLRHGRGFTYRGPDGTTIARGPERKRLEALAVPPAYEDVWISPLENGHLQATGKDTRARKQYRYHELWSEQQARAKFDALPLFGAALPRMRRRIRKDLGEDEGTQRFALAAAAALMDRMALRVGNPEYARENGSYGALTLTRKHLKLSGNSIKLDYTAKGGKRVRRSLSDRTLARALHAAADLPGATLLSWTESGAPASINSGTLNDYLREISGEEETTAKTFRTWAGTVAAFEVASAGDATIKAMSEAAADRLKNTPTIARNSYIHPDVIALAGTQPDLPEADPIRDLRTSETQLLAFLT